GAGKQFLDRFFHRLSALPQVVATGAISSRPIEGGDTGMGIVAIPTNHSGTAGPPPWAGWRIVSPGYFHAVGLPLLHGRAFDEFSRAGLRSLPIRRRPRWPMRRC